MLGRESPLDFKGICRYSVFFDFFFSHETTFDLGAEFQDCRFKKSLTQAVCLEVR